MSVALEVRGLRAGYGAVEVLHGIDLDVPGTGVTALLGRNGAGKSTTLATLAGLVRTRSGSARWQGSEITRWSPLQRAQSGVLLVPERHAIFPGLTVEENLAVFARDDTERARFDELQATFPVLAERSRQRAGSLSGGEQQMLALSRVLLQQPRLALLDEVSAGLAPRVAAQLMDVVVEVARRCSVVLVEQYVTEALAVAEVVHVLDRGVIVFVGEPGELEGGALPLPR
jgi:branched-chain amino acid transport system ATP-binding protein